MRVKYTKAELALRRELKEKHKMADSEIARGQLRESLQRIRDAAVARANDRANRTIEAAKPEREDFTNEAEFDRALELYRLDLSEMASKRVLDNPTFGLRARIQAEKKLKEISSRRLRLTGGTPSPHPIESEPKATLPESLPDLTKMSDIELRERFSKEKWFRGNLFVTNNGPLIDALEAKIRTRSATKSAASVCSKNPIKEK